MNYVKAILIYLIETSDEKYRKILKEEIQQKLSGIVEDEFMKTIAQSYIEEGWGTR